jgi:hypothetical protein
LINRIVSANGIGRFFRFFFDSGRFHDRSRFDDGGWRFHDRSRFDDGGGRLNNGSRFDDRGRINHLHFWYRVRFDRFFGFNLWLDDRFGRYCCRSATVATNQE